MTYRDGVLRKHDFPSGATLEDALAGMASIGVREESVESLSRATGVAKSRKQEPPSEHYDAICRQFSLGRENPDEVAFERKGPRFRGCFGAHPPRTVYSQVREE